MKGNSRVCVCVCVCVDMWVLTRMSCALSVYEKTVCKTFCLVNEKYLVVCEDVFVFLLLVCERVRLFSNCGSSVT